MVNPNASLIHRLQFHQYLTSISFSFLLWFPLPFDCNILLVTVNYILTAIYMVTVIYIYCQWFLYMSDFSLLNACVFISPLCFWSLINLCVFGLFTSTNESCIETTCLDVNPFQQKSFCVASAFFFYLCIAMVSVFLSPLHINDLGILFTVF